MFEVFRTETSVLEGRAMKTIAGKRVLVTGSGHGLGLEIARAFARGGAEVLITDRDPQRVEEAVFRLRSLNFKAAGFVMDVTDAADVRAVREQILTDFGSIDVLINNAGIVTGGQFLDVPLEKHLATYDVNSAGPVIVTHMFLPDLMAQEEGHLVNVASASALIPLPNAATYASSKWAVLGFTESLREELRLAGHSNITVTAVCPSYINTGMFNGVQAPLLTRLLTPEWLANEIVTCVLRRCETLIAPKLVNLLPLAKATWPRRAFGWLLDVLGVSNSMLNWQGHGAAHVPTPAAPVVETVAKSTLEPVRSAS